jgi:hypothetical protein
MERSQRVSARTNDVDACKAAQDGWYREGLCRSSRGVHSLDPARPP